MSNPMFLEGNKLRWEWMYGAWDCSLEVGLDGKAYFHAWNTETDADTESISDVYPTIPDEN